MPGRAGVAVEERVGVVDVDGQRVGFGDDELDEVLVGVVGAMLAAVGPVVACVDQRRDDRGDLDGGALVVEHHAGAWVAGVVGERRFDQRRWMSKIRWMSTARGTSDSARAASHRKTSRPR